MRARAGIAGAVAVVVCLLIAEPASGASPLTSAWPKGVTVVADSPLPPRDTPALVPMGNRLLVFGGGHMGEGVSVVDGHRDGAILDLQSKRWRSIAPAPFPLVAPAGVWTGKQVVVVGTEVVCTNEFGENECRTGHLRAATYTPATDRWQDLELPDDLAATETNSWTPHAARWTGREAIFSLGFGLLAIDPGRGSGSTIRQETPPDTAGQCASRRFFALVGLGHPSIQTLRLVPEILGPGSSAFRTGPTFDVAAPVSALSAACTTTTAFVVSTDLSTVAGYDVAARRWSSVAPPSGTAPCATGCQQYRVSGHGGVVDAWLPGGTRALRYATKADRWTEVAPGPGIDTSAEITWVGDLGVTTRFDPSSGADTGELVVWRPR